MNIRYTFKTNHLLEIMIAMFLRIYAFFYTFCHIFMKESAMSYLRCHTALLALALFLELEERKHFLPLITVS